MKKGLASVIQKAVDSDPDCPVVVVPCLEVKEEYADSTQNDHECLLEELLYPLDKTEFLKLWFQKCAVHICCKSSNGLKPIFKKLIGEDLYGLDELELLKNTSSEKIFVWLVDAMGRVSSIELDDPNVAHSLYRHGGHAAYCRAPPHVEQPLVAALLKDTGLGCGQYDPSGLHSTCLGRGEVECFLSTPGHTTDWHWDFQHNFTLQLSGVKRWTLQRGPIDHPLRACTPHYAAPDAVEPQLKAGRLSSPDLEFGKPAANSASSTKQIILNPGDVLYFPAGMWHRVETLEPGISINVSLMATNYAQLVSSSLQHYLLMQPGGWNQAIVHNDHSSVEEMLKKLTMELPKICHNLVNHHNFYQCMIPPSHRHALDVQAAETDGETMEDFDDNESSDDQESDNSMVINVDEFTAPEHWQYRRDAPYRRNPLALLMTNREMTDYYNSDSSDEEEVFVLNVNYAGNESLESVARVTFRTNSSDTKALLHYFIHVDKGCEKDTSQMQPPEKKSKPTPYPPSFLFYYGYLVWTN